MGVYVRFWNVTELKVNVRFIGSTFIGHGTHQNLLKHFHEVTKELDHSKLYQISNLWSKCKFRIPQRNSSR